MAELPRPPNIASTDIGKITSMRLSGEQMIYCLNDGQAGHEPIRLGELEISEPQAPATSLNTSIDKPNSWQLLDRYKTESARPPAEPSGLKCLGLFNCLGDPTELLAEPRAVLYGRPGYPSILSPSRYAGLLRVSNSLPPIRTRNPCYQTACAGNAGRNGTGISNERPARSLCETGWFVFGTKSWADFAD